MQCFVIWLVTSRLINSYYCVVVDRNIYNIEWACTCYFQHFIIRQQTAVAHTGVFFDQYFNKRLTKLLFDQLNVWLRIFSIVRFHQANSIPFVSPAPTLSLGSGLERLPIPSTNDWIVTCGMTTVRLKEWEYFDGCQMEMIVNRHGRYVLHVRYTIHKLTHYRALKTKGMACNFYQFVGMKYLLYY